MSHEKETKPIQASTADLLHFRKESLDWSAKEASGYPARLLVTRVSLIYLVDEFFFFFPGVVEQSREAG